MTPMDLRNIHTNRKSCREVVGTHFHVQHDTKTTLLFLPDNEEISWLLLPSLLSLLSGSRL